MRCPIICGLPPILTFGKKSAEPIKMRLDVSKCHPMSSKICIKPEATPALMRAVEGYVAQGLTAARTSLWNRPILQVWVVICPGPPTRKSFQTWTPSCHKFLQTHSHCKWLCSAVSSILMDPNSQFVFAWLGTIDSVPDCHALAVCFLLCQSAPPRAKHLQYPRGNQPSIMCRWPLAVLTLESSIKYTVYFL